MARLSNASSTKCESSTPARTRHTSRPSVTKEDIQKVEQKIVEAERMIEGAVTSHKTKTFEREQAALQKIWKSKEFQTKVEAFRWELLAKEALLPPKTNLGRKLALDRINRRVNGFEARLEREMLYEQATKAAKQPQKSPKLYMLSMPLHVYQGRNPNPEEQTQTKAKTPRKPSPPRPTSTIEKMTTTLGERVPVELSPTGLAYFPRHDKDDNDWERVAQHSMPIAATETQVREARETKQVQREEKEGHFEKESVQEFVRSQVGIKSV